MKKEAGIYQHFSVEEREFVEKMIDLCQRVEESYSYHLTAFLNPREEEILQSIASFYHLATFSSRHFLPSEFVRVIVAPDYYVLDQEDFEMVALEILYPIKFHTLSHSQVLGTLIHQLGIRREWIGDIIPAGDSLYVVLEKKFAELAQSTISKISRVPVTWKECSFDRLPLSTKTDGQSRQVLLSSLRLDKVVAVAFKLSRANAGRLIEAGQVKIDYREIKQTGKTVDMGQLVSVRGFGRVRLKELVGTSKQGKFKVELDIIKK